MSEHDQQAALVQWFKLKYPKYADCIIAIPNGSWLNGKGRFALMNKLKKEGLKPGASDLFIAVPKGDKHGMWLEVKDYGKTLCSVSKEQQEHLDLMIEMGYEGVWGSGFDILKSAVETYMHQ